MHHPQGPQRLDQSDLERVEIRELRVALEDVARAARAFPRAGPRAASTGPGSRGPSCSRRDRRSAARPRSTARCCGGSRRGCADSEACPACGEARLDEVEQLVRHLLVAHAVCSPATSTVEQQVRDRVAPHRLAATAARDARSGARRRPHGCARGSGRSTADRRPSRAPATARRGADRSRSDSRERPARSISQSLAMRQLERRDHRDLRLRQLAREVVLLRDRRIAPAARPVELHDHRLCRPRYPPGIRGFRSCRARGCGRHRQIPRRRPRPRSNLVTGSQTGPYRPLVSCRHLIVEH